MKFLFWNIQKKQLIDEGAELISECDCQLAAIAEASDEVAEAIVEKLRSQHNLPESAHIITPGCEKLKIISTREPGKISLLNQNRNFSLIKFEHQGGDLICGFVHFPSRLHHTMDQIRRAGEVLRDQLVNEENSSGIRDSIIMGDFNVNPFELPMVSFSGLGATNGIACSKRDIIVRDGEANRLFYNPMWTLYSANKDRPGSHRYLRTGEDVISWHFLDQVIIRPTLIEKFNFNSLKLIERTTNFSLINKSNHPRLSDHLPLVCEIQLDKE